MIKLVHKQGNISLTAPTGYKQSEVNEMLAEQEEKLEKEHLEEIEDINEAHNEEITEINEAHSKEVADINTAHANEVDAINEAHTKEVNELNTEHANEISELNAAHEQAVEDLNTAHGQVVNDLNGQIGELNADISELNAEIDDLEEQLAAADPSKIPTDEELTITGDCNYRFANGGWDWFVEKYGNRMTTKDIKSMTNMFVYTDLTNIPFEINCKKDATYIDATYMFSSCKNLLSIPKINNCKVSGMNSIFQGSYTIRHIPEDIDTWFDWSYMESSTSAYSCSRANTFYGCTSLRSIPMEFLNHGNPNASYSNSIYTGCFNGCCVLDEVIGLPFPHLKAAWTSNAFNNAFNNCSRLKDLTFAVQEDGTPYTVKWKTQTISLNSYIGYLSTSDKYKITQYNSGITADKEVTDDVSYQALKNDPDWFTTKEEYSRYNHDSAVATINSLPDSSAYGTNTIKFKGAAGSKTDGGAINTLTEAEIAVAAAKGWTVTLA